MNALSRETSAYLLQHAHNPVNWYPWGDEAFSRAVTEDKPIFLSIGYSACHWCHVMERESFEDPAIAKLLNDDFISIKVDREERPDVDALYIEAIAAMTGHAGWPASLFLLPDRRPFWGGTYLPPAPRHGLPSFSQLLDRVTAAWRDHRSDLVAQAEQLVEHLGDTQVRATRDLAYEGAVAAVLARHDDRLGGFGSGQKFPQVALLELVLLAAVDGDKVAANAIDVTLRAMDEGGLQDHLGGGFHRYCVDANWTVPHFEKMLYDNAQLVRLYARAGSWYRSQQRPDRASECARVVEDTVAYLLRDLQCKETGAFFASEDADDPSGEGGFYSFSAAEARAVLGDAPLPYGISPDGNFEHGRTVLNTREGRPPAAVKAALLAARALRPRPGIDRKQVVAWNALTIEALAEAGRLYARLDWIDVAVRALDTLLAARDVTGRFPRVLGTRLPGVLDDHVFVAAALLALYQAQPWQSRWLALAADLVDNIQLWFGDTDSSLLYAAEARPDLFLRKQDLSDGAEPCANARFGEVLRQLIAFGAVPAERLDAYLQAAGPQMSQSPLSTPGSWALRRPVAAWEITIVGDALSDEVQALVGGVNGVWRPQLTVAVRAVDEPAGRFSAFEGKTAPGAYLCRQGACGLPVTSVEALELALRAV